MTRICGIAFTYLDGKISVVAECTKKGRWSEEFPLGDNERICGFVGKSTVHGYMNVLAFRYFDLKEVFAETLD